MKVYYGKQDWAEGYNPDGSLGDVYSKIVNVPPQNSTEFGWVGFNIMLPNQEKPGYAASGAIEPADQDPDPEITLNVVNATALSYLNGTFEPWDPSWWNVTQVYATITLGSSSGLTSGVFEFQGLDNCSPYTVLLKGLKNDTQDRPFLISIKETWLDPQNLIELTPSSTSAIVASALIGSGLIVYDLNSQRKRKKPRNAHFVRKNGRERKGSWLKRKEARAKKRSP
ncbi:MAG: hypothetical protein ABSC91_10530 [Candidatus Bathyarchaeia archaeon]